MKESNGTTSNHRAFNPFAGLKLEYVIPTTPPQEEIWMACKLGGTKASMSYNESISLILKGVLNIKALKTALDEVIIRHQALRATFSTNGRFMSVFENMPIVMERFDFSELPEKTKKEYVA
ncbi:MAG: condensation domain-containing protein, partial [Leeuwenhoekiella sp.]